MHMQCAEHKNTGFVLHFMKWENPGFSEEQVTKEVETTSQES